MKNEYEINYEYEINLRHTFDNYCQAEKEWHLSLHNKLSEAEQEEAYKNMCLRREEYRKAVNAKKD